MQAILSSLKSYSQFKWLLGLLLIASTVYAAVDPIEFQDIKVNGNASVAGNVTISGALNMAGEINLESPLDMLQVATPANPAASRNKLYFKADNNLYSLTSGGVEAQVGGSTGANTFLSNLTAPTAINEDLENDDYRIGGVNSTYQGGSGTGMEIKEGSLLTFIKFGSEDLTAAGTAGKIIQVESGSNVGNGAGATQPTGDIIVVSGSADGTTSTGNLIYRTGNKSGASGVTGAFDWFTGNNDTAGGASGPMTLGTGSTDGGISGQIDILSGGSASASSGDINLTTGSGSIVSGNINILTSDAPDTGAITIRSGVGSTTSGPVKVKSGGTSAFPSDTSGNVALYSGYANTASGSAELYSGNIGGGGGNSGIVRVFSGDGTTTSGNVSVFSGQSDDAGSGSVEVTSGPVVVGTGDSGEARLLTGTTDVGNSGNIVVRSGNGANSSGTIFLETGVSGTRGDIRFVNGSEGTAGFLWTSSDTAGSGDWVAPTFANISLSNLAATTALNADLLPSAPNLRSVGTLTTYFSQAVATNTRAVSLSLFTSGFGVQKYTSTAVNATSPGGTSVDVNNRTGLEGDDLGFWTINDAAADANATGAMFLETGNKSAGTGNSGTISVRTGTSAGGTRGSISFDMFRWVIPATITAGGTTGNQTIDKISGTVNIAAAGTTVTVTNNTVTANSIVLAIARTNDATCFVKNVVPAAGSFVLNTTSACTAETSFGFLVLN